MKPGKVLTVTNEVLRVLRERDDLMTINQLVTATGASRANAVDFTGDDRTGKTYWLARPPEDDKRIKCFLERTPESKPRRRAKRPTPKSSGPIGR